MKSIPQVDALLAEAKKLYSEGYAIHWLHPKSKRPIESGWTTGPRKDWDDLEKHYRPGLNVGVRLGTPSKVKGNFLAVIDVDVKSQEEKHRKEVQDILRQLTGIDTLPAVKSGRGNGSRHFYALTPVPLLPRKALQSKELVEVYMPSATPSKRERERLSPEKIDAGLRLRAAWEFSVMGEGQQVVLPPSIHPDSGQAYTWAKRCEPQAFDFDQLPAAAPSGDTTPKGAGASAKPGPKPLLEAFTVEPVDIDWLGLPADILSLIKDGREDIDRSAMLLPCCAALLNAGLNTNEILNVLTDRNLFMGSVGFDHAQTKSREAAARWVFKYSLAKVIASKSAERLFGDGPSEAPAELSESEIAKEAEEFATAHDWRLDLECTKDDKVKGSLGNVVMILKNAGGPAIVKRDLFSIRDFYGAQAPWGGIEGAAITDDDVKLIKHWLGREYGFEPNSNTISEALTLVALENSFDPIKEWLEALPPWDEVARLDTWLARGFGAEGDPEYLAQVFRKWMVAMIVRTYKPGAKFDWMPIFEGKQGVGKSSFGRILVGDKYFADWLPDVMNKDAALALQGNWAVEMGELASFKKELENLKAFVTRTVDKVRPPYGERQIEIPRRCVFFGTTNSKKYLKDDSGNRRFKPVKVGELDFKMLEREREQLFSEALWLYRAGFETERTLELTKETRAFEAEMHAEKMVRGDADLMCDLWLDFVDRESAKNSEEKFNFSKFKLHDLFGVGVSLQGHPVFKNWKFDKRTEGFAAEALKLAGAESWKSDGLKVWRYPKRDT